MLAPKRNQNKKRSGRKVRARKPIGKRSRKTGRARPRRRANKRVPLSRGLRSGGASNAREYVGMVRDPEHHLARLPDGFASGSIALRSCQSYTITTDTSGNARILLIGHPAAILGQAISAAGGNMILATGAGTDAKSWVTGIATASVQSSNGANIDYSSWNSYGTKFRPLSACARFQYIGPHGDSQTGYASVLQGDMNWSGIASTGITGDFAVPIAMNTAAAVTAGFGSDNVIKSNPKAKKMRAGQDFYVPIPCQSSESFAWRDLAAGLSTYLNTWTPNYLQASVPTASQVAQFAGLGSVAIGMYGMAGSSSKAVYEMTLTYCVEVVPQTQYNLLIPPASVPATPSALTVAEDVMAKLRDSGSFSSRAEEPYVSDSMTTLAGYLGGAATLGAAAYQGYHRARRQLGY